MKFWGWIGARTWCRVSLVLGAYIGVVILGGYKGVFGEIIQVWGCSFGCTSSLGGGISLTKFPTKKTRV